jgi:hypothetical protein
MGLEPNTGRDTWAVSADSVVHLYRGTGQRIFAGLMAAMFAAISVGFVLLGGGLALQSGLIPKILGIGMIVSFPLLGFLVAFDDLRSAFATRGTLVVSDHALTIHQPEHFKSPQVVLRTSVASVSIGTDATRAFAEASRRGVTASFRRPWADAPLPVVVSRFAEVPNLLLSFSPPVRLGRVRGVSTMYGAWGGRSPSSGTTTSGLWFRVADEGQARRAFVDWLA